MCGRIYTPSQAEIERFWHLGPGNSNPFARRYNVAPSQGNPKLYVPVIRSGEDEKPELTQLQWWLLPFFSKEPKVKYSTFNARLETVAKSPSFREPFRKKRCLIPVLGYYEWQVSPKGKLPWLIQSANGELMHFGGLYDRWKREDQVIESCTIIVGPTCETIKSIHDRQPVIIPPEKHEAWLDRKLNDVVQVMELLQPVPEDAVKFHRVGTGVNNARNEGGELVEEVDANGSGLVV
jgi:putative SOS response-associated peptidase YedK